MGAKRKKKTGFGPQRKKKSIERTPAGFSRRVVPELEKGVGIFRTGETIPAGTIIGRYEGTHTFEKKRRKFFTEKRYISECRVEKGWVYIDGAKGKGNWGRLINSSWKMGKHKWHTNCMLESEDGSDYDCVLNIIAETDIHTGDQLLLSYKW